MKVLPVNSSTIMGVAYDYTTLYLHFQGHGESDVGYWYSYEEVAPDVVLDLLLSYSPGTFFAMKIKGQYRTTKLTWTEVADLALHV